MFCCCSSDGGGSAEVIEAQPAVTPQDEPVALETLEEEAANRSAEIVEEAAKEEEGKVFKAVLKRAAPGEALGMKTDLSDERCAHVSVLTSDAESPVTRYNASVPASQRIQYGDFLLSINGVSAATSVPEGQKLSSMLKAELGAENIELVVSRPQEYTVSVEKQGRPLGLDLKFSNKLGRSVFIHAIKDGGAVQSDASEVVQPLDRIVAVNGVEGGPKQLVDAISKSGDTITLRIVRPY